VFIHAGGAKTRHDLGILVFASRLRQIDGMAKNDVDILRHGIQITLGGTNPFHGLASLLGH